MDELQPATEPVVNTGGAVERQACCDAGTAQMDDAALAREAVFVENMRRADEYLKRKKEKEEQKRQQQAAAAASAARRGGISSGGRGGHGGNSRQHTSFS